MFLILYRVLATLLSPFLYLYYIVFHRLTRDERAALLGKCPLYRLEDSVLWIHGANLGELHAAYKIVLLLAHHPALLARITAITLTSATPHAARAISTLFSRPLPPPLRQKTLRAHLLPLDSPRAVKKFLDSTPITAGLIIEAELRPILLTQVAARSIPLFLHDARLGTLSHRLWSTLAPSVATAAFSSFSYIAAQTFEDASRISAFYPNSHIPLATSLKFLRSPTHNVPHPDLQRFKRALAGRPVWVAASTHPPDELPMLLAHRLLRIQSALQDAVLIIVPRHPDRGRPIAEAAVAQGFEPYSVTRRAAGYDQVTPDTAVYIADTLGELPLFYGLANVVFIGNSFGPDGDGHNFAEAAHFGCCVVHGPRFAAFDPLLKNVFRVLDKHHGDAVEDACRQPCERLLWTLPCVEAANADDLARMISAALLQSEETSESGKGFQAAVRKLSASAELEVLATMQNMLVNRPIRYAG